jgi:hypothetical protein
MNGFRASGWRLSSFVSGALLQTFAEKSTTGVRFLCIDTVGNVHSQAAACSGT